MESIKRYVYFLIYVLLYGDYICRSLNWDIQFKKFLFGVQVIFRCEKQFKDWVGLNVILIEIY